MDEEGLRLVPLSARQPSPSISPSVLSASVKSTLPSQLYRVPLFPASSTLSSPSRFSRESSIVSKFPRASPAHNDRNKNAAHRSALFKDRACRFSISLLSSFSFSLLLFHESARAARHPFYAGDELASQRGGYGDRIDCFIADYVSYAFCPVILSKWTPGIAILADSAPRG